MEYSKLIAITGMPGLHEMVSSRNDGAVVKSLEDGKTQFVTNRVHNFSHLESIEVYTVRDNVNLVDVFKAMETAGASLPDVKDNAAIKKYFEKVFADMDFDRVYPSDMKKMVKWYEQLKKHNIEIKLSELPEEEPAEEANAAVVNHEEQIADEAPKKKGRKKKED